jgi:hypothetical protein
MTIAPSDRTGRHACPEWARITWADSMEEFRVLIGAGSHYNAHRLDVKMGNVERSKPVIVTYFDGREAVYKSIKECIRREKLTKQCMVLYLAGTMKRKDGKMFRLAD